MEKYTYKELRELNTEELRVIALKKKRNGCATKQALLAQQILYARAGCPFSSSSHWVRDNSAVRKI